MLFFSTSSFGKLRIGLIYTGDSFPIYHGKVAKFYENQGVDVDIVNFMSAMERDSALQAGSIDGANGDLIGASLMYHSHKNIQVTGLTLGDQFNIRRVSLLVSDPNIKEPKDLKGREVAISPNTIIEYLLHRLLKKENISSADVKTSSVNNIPLRLTLLEQKKLTAALLPEPLASKAVVDGSKILIDDKNDFYSHAVVVFRKDALNKKGAEVKKFMEALAKTVDVINKNPESYRESIADRCRVPSAVKDSFFLYKYAYEKLPSLELFNDVQDWLIETKKLPSKIPYQGLINEQYYRSQPAKV